MAWVNPRYREITGADPPKPHDTRQAVAAEAPAETGQRLAAIPRTKRQGPAEELRIHLAEFEGHPYIAVRLWSFDPKSGWWPVKGKGVSIRLREAERVSEALLEAVRLADPDNRPAPRSEAARPAARDRRTQQFNEFEE